MKNGNEFIREELEKCVKCGKCRWICPVFAEEQREPFVARGHFSLLEELRNQTIKPEGSRIKELFGKCILCTSCVEICPNDAPTDTIVTLARHMLLEHSSLPLYKKLFFWLLKDRKKLDLTVTAGAAVSVAAKQKKNGQEFPFINRFFPKIYKKSLLQSLPDNPTKGENNVVLFMSCLVNYSYQSVGYALVDILKKLNIGSTLPKKQLCCGAPAYFAGDFETAAYLARHNIDLFEKLNLPVLLPEPTCASMIKYDYPKLFTFLEDDEYRKKAEKVSKLFYDPVFYLYHNSNLKKLMKNSINTNVTYHDPCHLAKTQKVTAEPRELIKKTGADIIEMSDSLRCCGNGGTFSIDWRNLSLKIMDKKIEDIKNTGAATVVTGCSACMMQISEGLYRKDQDIVVMHTLELINKALMPFTPQQK
ncbi:MAG: glycolate oxidase iron-sulfur subunit [bacterium]|nr:MAG: glycolate oxidase iron-sulfur subunit [bacterium]